MRLLPLLLLVACSSPAEKLPGAIAYAAQRDGHTVVVLGDRVVLAEAGADVFPAPGAPLLGIVSVPDAVEELILDGRGRLGGASRMTRNPSRPKDGSFIVFESDRASFRDLYRVDVATGEVKRLTDDREGNFEPSVSPDGLQVVFASSKAGNPDIHVMNSDGTNRRALTTEPSEEVSPAWSPDGAWIAFVSTRDGKDRIFVMKPDGSGVRKVTDVDGIESLPTWSPDSKHLAYVLQHPTGASEVRVVPLDGGASRTLSRTRTPHDDHPSWSPDGRWVAYTRGESEEEADIWVASADGKKHRRITSDPGVEMLPRWMP